MTRPTRIPHSRASQRGMTMIELLVVAAILGVGLLGLAALQVLTMKAAGGSRQRVAASYVAHSVLDGIAMEGAQSYFYEGSGQPVPAVFTRSYTGVTTNGNIGSFDVNGAFLSSSMTTPDGVIRATWERLPSKVAAAVAGAPQINEFLVNVSYLDGEQAKWFTVSRLVRY